MHKELVFLSRFFKRNNTVYIYVYTKERNPINSMASVRQ